MNPENRRQIIILSVVGLFLAAALYYALFMGGSSAPLSDAAQAAQGTAETIEFIEADVNIDELIKNLTEVSFKYAESREARNPMTPLLGVARSAIDPLGGPNGFTPGTRRRLSGENLIYEANRMDVTAIIWDETSPIAVVDDDVVRVGADFDTRGRIVVKEITNEGVVLSVQIEDTRIDVVRPLKEP